MSNNNNIFDEISIFTMTMVDNDWQYVKKNSDHIILNKKHNELDCVDIHNSDNIIHFTLPIKNSPYSFYKQFSLHDSNAVSFIKNYIFHFTN
jgi:hypothetical protein